MGILARGWRAYALLCVCVHAAIARTDGVYLDNWKSRGSEAVQAGQPLVERAQDEASSLGASFQRRLIPIKEPSADKKFAMLRLPLEPDAEMLPAHYERVKPPGVDHMELRYAESQVSQMLPNIEAKLSSQADGARQVSEGEESSSTNSEKGYEKVSTSQTAQKGDDLKEKKKSEYTEAGGKKKVQDDGGNSSGHEEEQAGGRKGSDYETKDNAHVDRKAHGYHNVYHKDEYKKDHDFYDNDDHGGHSKKHGRYNEKHVAIEGTFKKGAAGDSGFDEAQLHKEGIMEKGKMVGEAKGHDARGGYDRFFKNFHGFAKQKGKEDGKMFGFGQMKAR